MNEENPITQSDPEKLPTAGDPRSEHSEKAEGTHPDDVNEKDSHPDSESPQQQTDQQPADNPAEELRQLLTEAEERGYRRGLNQHLREALRSPGMFEDLARTKQQQPNPQTPPEDPLTSRFLTSIRPGIWD